MNLNTSIESVETAVIRLSGRLDAANAPALRDELAGVMDRGTHSIKLDLADVDFVDSAGLAALVSGMKRCRQNGGDLVLVRPRSDAAYRVFELTKFDAVFNMEQPS